MSPWMVLSRFRAFFFSEFSSFSFSSNITDRVCLHEAVSDFIQSNRLFNLGIFNRGTCELPCSDSGNLPGFLPDSHWCF